MLEAEVDDAHNNHQDGAADHRESTRPRAGLTIPALAEEILHRRTPTDHADLRDTTIRRLTRRTSKRACQPKARDESNTRKSIVSNGPCLSVHLPAVSARWRINANCCAYSSI